ncbi:MULTISPECIES: hypothetical protein [unclassified Caballeronia]|uniref:hypothetical protein n=1 Tax=unclassified Caballeronia TaxID=2646786 RepID=UPI0020277E42|nr:MULTISPECIES: hypothetical protein [unclassified Caballeronia]
MYGLRPETDHSTGDDVSALATDNAHLAETLHSARVAFEFLCATWPEVFLAETHAVLAGLGVRVRPPDALEWPPSHADEPNDGQDNGGGRHHDDKDDADDEDDEHGEGRHG